MDKIQRVSKFFRWVFQIAFISLPIMLIIFWVKAPLPILPSVATYGFTINYIPDGVKILSPLSIETKLLGFIISLIPLVVNLFVLYFLICLFKLYEKQEIFSKATVGYIKSIGYALLIGQLLNPIYEALLSATLTWHNPPGHRTAVITFSGTNISVVLIALLIILVSWIIAEGYKIQEDQKYTI